MDHLPQVIRSSLPGSQIQSHILNLASEKQSWNQEREYEREFNGIVNTMVCYLDLSFSTKALKSSNPQLPKMVPAGGSKKSTIPGCYIFEKEKQVMPCPKLWAFIRGSLHSMTVLYEGTETQILASIQVNYESLFDLILTSLWDWLKPLLQYHYKKFNFFLHSYSLKYVIAQNTHQ